MGRGDSLVNIEKSSDPSRVIFLSRQALPKTASRDNDLNNCLEGFSRHYIRIDECDWQG